MQTPRLPVELLHLVIDCLASLLLVGHGDDFDTEHLVLPEFELGPLWNCALSSRILANRAKVYLFKEITLAFVGRLGRKKYESRLSSLRQILEGNPTLSSYIQSFAVILSYDSYIFPISVLDNKDLHQVLGCLSDLRTFSLQFFQQALCISEVGKETRSALRELLVRNNKTLTCLKLRAIRDFTPLFILLCPSLKSIHCSLVDFDPSKSIHSINGQTPIPSSCTTIPSLQHARFDGTLEDLAALRQQERALFNFSQLKTLHTSLYSTIEIQETCSLLVEAQESLQHLYLMGIAIHKHAFIASWDANINLLNCLETLSIKLHFLEFGEALIHLLHPKNRPSSLRSLRIEAYIGPLSFMGLTDTWVELDRYWSPLGHLLTIRDLFPRLNQVTVHIDVVAGQSPEFAADFQGQLDAAFKPLAEASHILTRLKVLCFSISPPSTSPDGGDDLTSDSSSEDE